MKARQVWIGIASAILAGAVVGGAIAWAQRGDDIFQGGELPTPTDRQQAEIDALVAEAFGLLSMLAVLADAENCHEGCGGFGATPADAFEMVLARCSRSGWPDDDRRGMSDRAQALIDAINGVCGAATQAVAAGRRPGEDSEYREFAAATRPPLLDAYERSTGRPWPGTEATEPSEGAR
jgi:hypothetical protein